MPLKSTTTGEALYDRLSMYSDTLCRKTVLPRLSTSYGESH
jgi:hypothetical protein